MVINFEIGTLFGINNAMYSSSRVAGFSEGVTVQRGKLLGARACERRESGTKRCVGVAKYGGAGAERGAGASWSWNVLENGDYRN